MDDFHALLRSRVSLDDSTDNYTNFILTGSIFANVPGTPSKKLFTFNAINKARLAKPQSDKYMINSKEVLFFEDPATGDVLHTWTNPFTGEENEVLHTYNDPVNMPLFPAFIKPPRKLHNDTLAVFPQTIPLRYPNPLKPELYPEYSTGDWYIASETFITSSWRKHAYDETKESTPCMILWTRTCPWLPWMKMGERPGGLFYIAQCLKLGSKEDIPPHISERIQRLFPEFHEPAQSLTTPNQSSWTTFKAAIDARREGGALSPQSLSADKVGEVLPNPVQSSAMKTYGFELLGNKEFTFDVSGEVSVIGSSERRLPFEIKGVCEMQTEIQENDIKVSLQYKLIVYDKKTGFPLEFVPRPDSEEMLEVPAFQDSLEVKLTSKDVASVLFNKLRAFSFATKNNSLISMHHINLVFPQDTTPSDSALFFLTSSIPLSPWMKTAAPGKYCILNVCG